MYNSASILSYTNIFIRNHDKIYFGVVNNYPRINDYTVSPVGESNRRYQPSSYINRGDRYSALLYKAPMPESLDHVDDIFGYLTKHLDPFEFDENTIHDCVCSILYKCGIELPDKITCSDLDSIIFEQVNILNGEGDSYKKSKFNQGYP